MSYIMFVKRHSYPGLRMLSLVPKQMKYVLVLFGDTWLQDASSCCPVGDMLVICQAENIPNNDNKGTSLDSLRNLKNPYPRDGKSLRGSPLISMLESSK